MLKFLLGRRGKEALSHWLYAGVEMPPLEEGGKVGYEFNRQGIVVYGNEIEVKKGVNVIELPTPKLKETAILLTEIAPEAIEGLGSGIAMPIRIWGRETVARDVVRLVVNVKSDSTYSGPLACYYVMSDR